jgi:hypothetical protein
MKKSMLIPMALALAASCSVQKQWTAVGGSRADGTITMAYEYGWLQAPQVDDAQGEQAAGAACTNWGYTAAQAFPGGEQVCEARYGYGNCIQFLVKKNFQCLGAPASGRALDANVSTPQPAAKQQVTQMPQNTGAARPTAASMASPPQRAVTQTWDRVP